MTSATLFASKHVVVTGGTGALGTAVVTELLDLGASVHIPAFSEAEVQRFALADNPNVHLTSDVDLTDEAAVTAFYAQLPSLYASIHIAGGFDMSALAETGSDAFMKQMTMNALTCFLCCREATRAIRTSEKTGRLVNVAARPGVEPRQGAGMAAYAASKAAVAALTESLGEELAPEGIWVNAVAPSILDTAANRDAMPDADHASWPTTQAVAATLVHLASPANAVARGAVVPVYGKV